MCYLFVLMGCGTVLKNIYFAMKEADATYDQNITADSDAVGKSIIGSSIGIKQFAELGHCHWIGDLRRSRNSFDWQEKKYEDYQD